MAVEQGVVGKSLSVNEMQQNLPGSSLAVRGARKAHLSRSFCISLCLSLSLILSLLFSLPLYLSLSISHSLYCSHSLPISLSWLNNPCILGALRVYIVAVVCLGCWEVMGGSVLIPLADQTHDRRRRRRKINQPTHGGLHACCCWRLHLECRNLSGQISNENQANSACYFRPELHYFRPELHLLYHTTLHSIGLWWRG